MEVNTGWKYSCHLKLYGNAQAQRPYHLHRNKQSVCLLSAAKAFHLIDEEVWSVSGFWTGPGTVPLKSCCGRLAYSFKRIVAHQEFPHTCLSPRQGHWGSMHHNTVEGAHNITSRWWSLHFRESISMVVPPNQPETCYREQMDYQKNMKTLPDMIKLFDAHRGATGFSLHTDHGCSQRWCRHPLDVAGSVSFWIPKLWGLQLVTLVCLQSLVNL